MNRRDFHKLSMGAAAASLLPSLPAFAAAPPTVASNDGHKFSVMLWTLPKGLTFVQQLQLASDAGFTGVEVGNEYEKWTPEEWKTNLAKQHELGIAVDSAVPGRNALADKSKRTPLHDDLLKAIPGAKQLGCKQFIYTAYTRVPEQTPEEQRAAIVDTLKYAADLLEKDDIEIVLEPIDLLEHKQEAVVSVGEAFEITRAVGSPRIKVLYDFYHEQRQAGNLIEKLTKNVDQVGLVHIADVPGRHQPGTGEVNYTNIYRELARLKYDRYICMEFMSQGDPVTVLRKAREEAIAAMKSA
ncbi:TIM barrel protein [Terriglobus roseus]|uniref:Hydroxypyruvate isomerase n=1 Tax=Terriglobus roseus TaxID=392734 RepID=A0A1H4PNN2_9BACT|nr:TIM barrel protein [Terriglobus roseus]SEC08989.1 hydroxypyruvate isomerase [Terriglobus roseus]